ncbi:hypothetical protein HDU96_001210 [Phlyctochytrium bullatum]|nr:hypothetical protein HDU96_001210 [Phlyctochytrium bullatum]
MEVDTPLELATSSAAAATLLTTTATAALASSTSLAPSTLRSLRRWTHRHPLLATAAAAAIVGAAAWTVLSHVLPSTTPATDDDEPGLDEEVALLRIDKDPAGAPRVSPPNSPPTPPSRSATSSPVPTRAAGSKPPSAPSSPSFLSSLGLRRSGRGSHAAKDALVVTISVQNVLLWNPSPDPQYPNYAFLERALPTLQALVSHPRFIVHLVAVTASPAENKQILQLLRSAGLFRKGLDPNRVLFFPDENAKCEAVMSLKPFVHVDAVDSSVIRVAAVEGVKRVVRVRKGSSAIPQGAAGGLERGAAATSLAKQHQHLVIEDETGPEDVDFFDAEEDSLDEEDDAMGTSTLAASVVGGSSGASTVLSPVAASPVSLAFPATASPIPIPNPAAAFQHHQPQPQDFDASTMQQQQAQAPVAAASAPASLSTSTATTVTSSPLTTPSGKPLSPPPQIRFKPLLAAETSEATMFFASSPTVVSPISPSVAVTTAPTTPASTNASTPATSPTSSPLLPATSGAVVTAAPAASSQPAHTLRRRTSSVSSLSTLVSQSAGGGGGIAMSRSGSTRSSASSGVATVVPMTKAGVVLAPVVVATGVGAADETGAVKPLPAGSAASRRRRMLLRSPVPVGVMFPPNVVLSETFADARLAE